MLDLACYAVSPHALPVAALLRRDGVPMALAHLLEQAIVDRASRDPGLDAAVDGLLLPERPVPCPPPATIDDPCGAVADAVAPSTLLGPAFVEALAASAPDSIDALLRSDAGGAQGAIALRRAALRDLLLSTRLRNGSPLASRLARLLEIAPAERGILGAALATLPGAELLVCHGADLEYALGAPPRMVLTRALARLRALASCAEGRVVVFVPCDPWRPQVLAVVREALARGFAGVSLPGAIGEALASDHARSARARLLEVLQHCAKVGASATIHLGAGFADVGGSHDASDIAAWAALLGHRRLASLRVCLVPAGPGFAVEGDGATATVEADDAVNAALDLAASRPHTWCALSPALAAVGPAAVAEAKPQATRLWRDGILGAVRRDRRLRGRLCMASCLPHGDHALVAAGRENLGPILRASKAPAGFERAFGRESALEFLDLPRFAKRCALSLAPAELAGLERLASPRPARARRASASTARPASRTRRTGIATAAADVADCIIIGAGIAGAAAANAIAMRARRRGVPADVVLVEASGRIGGRLHTWRDGPWGPLELGAELIHRPPMDQLFGNFSLWNDVRRFGLSTRSIDKLSASFIYCRDWQKPGEPLRSGCAVCSDPGAAKGLDVLDRANGWTTTRNTPDVAAQTLLAPAVAAGAVAEQLGDLLLTGTVPGRLHELSVASLAADRVKDQELSTEEYHVDAGFDALPEALTRSIDVRLGFEVDRISWGPGGVVVRGRSGETLRAACAVCTVSVGVLKSGAIEFDPPLPEFKQEAIRRLECGPISKAVLVFDRRFWPTEMSILGNLHGRRRAGRSYFVPLYGADAAAPVITGLFNGELARRLDAAMAGRADADSDDVLPTGVRAGVGALLERAAEDLREVFQDDTPTLLRWRVRSWANDPLVRGGTSFVRYEPGGTSRAAARVRWALRHPSPPLFWAGEATAVFTNPWSVHGAHASGVDAARMVEEFLHPTGE